MPSYQSELGEGEGIAEELARSQRSISIAEFFEKNKHMLGFDSEARAIVTAVKEAVDNALDAAEEAGILPDIYVEIEEAGDYYRLVVEDNGPGITKEQIPRVFGKLLYGSRFHKREQSLLPDQQVLIRRDGEVELVEIGRLCDSYLPPDGEGTMRVGGSIEAPCFDRETGEVTWQDVTHVIRHETAEETYRIGTSRGRDVEVTGNHSLFTLGEDGTVAEVAAAELSTGDHVLAPERIPSPADVESVNLLEHVPRSELDDRDWYVYGLDQSLVEEIIEEGERVRKFPTPDSGRKRTYHRLDGVEVLRDSLTNNYLPKGYLPADAIVDLGWEDRVADATIRTYQVGGDPDEVPVTVELDEAFMRFLGLYVAEGHADARQVGFTFGSHESGLVQEVERTAATVFDAGVTTVQRERNSTRVKTFGSPLAVFLDAVCGHGAADKHVPSFVFRAPSRLQQAFLDALYDGDGSDAHPSNELSLATTSERLAREVSYLWSMRGVAASWKKRTSSPNISGGETDVYGVLVHGEDVDRSLTYEADTDRTARYRRLPVSLLESFRDEPVDATTVPATRAGVFRAAGLGSQNRYADKFAFRAERLLAGESIPDDYYRRTLEEEGYVTEDGKPTGKLQRLWDLSDRLVSFGESDLCLLRVEGVERIDAPEYVYDISVPGTGADENFVAGNRGALCVKNSRGQQGIGISAAVLYSQLTSGKPARITSKTEGKEAQYFELIVDTDTNEPEIDTERETVWERPHGTRIELEMEGNMRARGQLHDYVKYTAVVNPHARIEFHEPQESLKFERATDQLPAETEEIRPHPHGVELGTLLKMLEATDSYSLSGFLQEEFTRVGGKTARKVLDRFRDRHFGREMSWRAPDARRRAAVEEAIDDAVSNKGATATAAFAERVLEGAEGVDADEVTGLLDREFVSYTDLERVVAAAAEATETATDRRFGSTVRENAVEAVWTVLTEERESDLYALVDGATTKRKDDAAVEALARRVATKFEAEGGVRDRLTYGTLTEWVAWAAERTKEREEETFGETSREKITGAIWDRARTVEEATPKVREVADDRDTAAEFLEAMRETDILAPPTDCLAPITSELVEAGLKKEYDADFYAASTRDAEVHGGDPFIVEAGIAYGGTLPAEGSVEILRFANRVPLVYQRGACATVDVVKRINWRNYNLDQPGGSGIPNGPAVLMIHVASTNVPFTSESKDAVANVPAIEDEVELALREAARELKSYLNKKRSLEQRRRKQNVIAEILPEMARKVSEVTGREPLNVEDSLARIMNNVLVERQRENGLVKLVVSNHDDTNASLEVTDIISADPGDVNGARVVEMDGEWFVKWTPEVAPGDEATLEYRVPDDTDFDITVEGIEGERVTIDT